MTDPYLTRALDDLAAQFTADVVLAEAHALWGPPVPSTPARADDPDTSTASGNRHRTIDVTRFSLDSNPGRLLSAIAETPRTAQEAAVVVTTARPAGLTSIAGYEGCRRRVSDLALAGYIEDSGDRRNNPGAKDPSIIWQATTAGRAALARAAETGWTRPKGAAA